MQKDPKAVEVQEVSFDIESLKTIVLDEMNRLQVPGVAVGIYFQGKEYYAAFGITNVNYPLPVDANTLFQIGSTTKTFTATTVMRLVETGKLNLDTPILDYLPEFRLSSPDLTSRATLRHVFTHTGGWLGDYFEDFGRSDDALQKYVASMANLEQLTPLGEIWSYNNSGFSLAGRVIEAVTGETYESVVKKLVLDPLGLTQSFFFAEDMMTYPVSAGHIFKEGKGPEVALPWGLARSANPAGALVSSVKDQLRYARFHLGKLPQREGIKDTLDNNIPPVLKPETLQMMQTPQAEAGSIAEAVGISWLLKTISGNRIVMHGGTTNGQLSAFLMVPDKDFAITVLTNSNRGGVLHSNVIKWALAHYLKLEEPEEHQLVLEPEALKSYTGKYSAALSDAGLKIENGGLVLEVVPKGGFPDKNSPPPSAPPPTRLAFVKPDRVVALDEPFKSAKGEFLRDKEGKLTWFRFGGRIGRRQES